jgi:hypothetical protein
MADFILSKREIVVELNFSLCILLRFDSLCKRLNHVAFYPGKMDACFVDGEQVQAQEGDFDGGWVTDEIVGPFKGGWGRLGGKVSVQKENVPPGLKRRSGEQGHSKGCNFEVTPFASLGF